MSKSASYRTDHQRVHGLGAAGEGVEHWWHQRLTSIALVPLTLLFIFPFIRSLGTEHAVALETYASPFNAIVAVLFLLVGFLHLQQGLQVVVEDYVSDKPMRTALLVANTLVCWAFALAGVFAVAKIAFTA
jgi:succinate dehydrogenase / fumarate reductase, membrane anchor subunit